MKYLRLFALGIVFSPLALSLSACQTMDGVAKDLSSIKMPSMNNSPRNSQAGKFIYDGDCPRVETVNELSTLYEFTSFGNQDPNNLVSSVDISNVQSACSYDEQSVTIDTQIYFQGALGARGRTSASSSTSYSYPFFVAVTSSDGKILAKEVFTAPLTYAPGQNTQTYTEKMRQIIPIENRDRGSRYKIIVGLQLNPDQLAYNRRLIAEREAEILRQQQAAQAQPMAQMKTQEMQEQANKEIYIGRPVAITP